MTLALIKATHYFALTVLLWASFSKNKLLAQQSLANVQIQNVLRFDKLSAAAAGTMLITGLLMLLWFSKPTAYYLDNGWFYVKLSIFIVASTLVVMSKIKLRQAIRSTSVDNWIVTAQVRWILRIDFIGIISMMILGLLISRGS